MNDQLYHPPHPVLRAGIALAGISSVLCLASTASAQSVNLYGVIDSGIEVVTNVGSSKSTVARVPSLTGSLPSRWGVRGSEDLGGGLKTVFVLESGFAPDQGSSNQGGRLFGRQAFVGLSGSWGTVSVGRQYSQIFYSLIGDTMGPNIYAAGLLDGYLANARLDNSIAYRGTFGGLTVGTTYSFGRDAVASAPAGGCAGESSSDRRACRDISGAIQYTTADWGAAMAFERMYGGAGAGSPLPASSQTDTRSIISGFAKVGGGTIGAGLVHRKNDGSPTHNSDFWFLGGNYPIGSVLLDLQYGRLNVKDSPNDASVIAARATYSFTKRSAVYVSVGRLQNKGNATFTVDGGVPTGSAPLPGVGQSGVMIGLRHTF